MFGEFVGRKGNAPFTSLDTDPAQEQENKILKGEGSLQGITNKPATFFEYCHASTELRWLSKETQEMLGIS